MEIYILRHGEAEPRGPRVVEAERALTRRGRRDVHHVVKQVGGLLDPELILTSPLRRALETADEAHTAWPRARVEQTDLLTPDAQPAALWKDLLRRNPRAVVLVGHEPNLGRLFAYLLGARIALDFKKGAMVRLAVEAEQKVPRGVLKWVLTPKLARGAR